MAKFPWYMKVIKYDPKNSLTVKFKIHPLFRFWLFIKLYFVNLLLIAKGEK